MRHAPVQQHIRRQRTAATYQSRAHHVEQARRHQDLRAAVVPVALDERLDLALDVAGLVLALVQPWLALALRFSRDDKLQALRDAPQPLVKRLAVVQDGIGRRVVAVVRQDGRVVACRLEELRAVEVPAEVVGEVNVLALEVVEAHGCVEVLLVQQRHFHGHFGGSLVRCSVLE
jgi:hypothetical protein